MGNKLLVWIARLCVCMSLGSSFLVAPLFAQFVYVANTGFNHSVSGLRINATTGALTIVPGSPFPADPSPTSIAVDPSGRFVYVPSNTANTISGYTINPASGALTPIPGSPFPAGNVGLSGTEPSAIIVDPTGKFAYAMNSNANFVSGYKINATSGALTPIPVSPCSTGGAPRAAAINSTGRLIYVVDGFNVFGCLIDPLTGALTPLLDSPFPGGAAPISIRVHVSGKFVYVLDAAGFIRRYAADPNSGMLTFLDATEVPGGNNFLPELDIDATGRFLYVVNDAIPTNNIVGYQIDSTTGTLTLMPGAPFSDQNELPNSLASDPTSKFAYVSHSQGQTNTVSGYSIDPVTGALTTLAGSPFVSGPANSASIAIAITPVIAECGTVFPSSLSFANQATETASNAETVVFSNGGTTPLTMSNISAAGPFAQSNTCGTSLAAGAHCTINVTFAPTSAGSQTGALTIVDSGPMSPHIVNLSGTGVVPDFSIKGAPGQLSAQTISPGATATYGLVLAATSGFPASVNLSCSGQPENSTCSVQPSALDLAAASQSTTTVVIGTTGSAAVGSWNIYGRQIPARLWLLCLAALAVIGCFWRSHRLLRMRPVLGTALVIAAVLFGSFGCNGMTSGSPARHPETAAGTYLITITGTSGSMVHTTNVQLTVR